MGTTLVILGVIIGAVGSILILKAAFNEGIGWGLATLLTCGIGALIFVIAHWEESKKGFLISVVGNIIQCIGVLMIPKADLPPFMRQLGSGQAGILATAKSSVAPGLPAFPGTGPIVRPADSEVPEQAAVTKVALPFSSSASKTGPVPKGPTTVAVPMKGPGVVVGPAVTSGNPSPTPVVKKVVDRQRVELLQTKYVGQSIEAAKRALGKPRLEMKVGHTVTIRYTDIELISEDGRTITRQYELSP